MAKTFLLNGNTYPIKDIGVNMLCDFEEMDISMADMQKKSMSFIRAYLSSCTGMDVTKTGRELELHLMNGGNLDGIMDAIKTAMEESDFFRAISKGAEKETPTDEEEPKQTRK